MDTMLLIAIITAGLLFWLGLLKTAALFVIVWLIGKFLQALDS